LSGIGTGYLIFKNWCSTSRATLIKKLISRDTQREREREREREVVDLLIEDVLNQICETDRKLGAVFLKGLFHWYPMNCSKKKGCATEVPMSVKGGLSIRHIKP